MRLFFKTRVAGRHADVYARFDENLFRALTPPFPPVKLLRFDGSRTGDEVHLQLGAPLKQLWISKITSDSCDDRLCLFVDEGTRLPFFLRFWRHEHRVRAAADIYGKPTCWIEDDIRFRPAPWIGPLLWPVLWLQFAARGPLYRRYFGAVD